MGHVDDPGDQQDYANDGEDSITDLSFDGTSSEGEGCVDSGILPTEVGDHLQEHDDCIGEDQSSPQDATLLAWIISELPVIERECDVLLDSETEGRHEAAARAILTALRVGVRRIKELNLQMPPYSESAATAAQARSFLHKIGTLLNEEVSEKGMKWPPPLLYPPPAVTRDLISLYALATVGSLRRDRRPDESFRAVLQLIDDRTTALLMDSGTRRIRAAKAVAESPPGTARSRVGLFLSGSAVLIGLLQGPGAAHDFYRDSLTLGGDIRSIALHIASEVSGSWRRTITEVSSVIDARLPRSSTDDSPPSNGNGRGGIENVAGPESDMEKIFATLDHLVTLLPTGSLEQANDSVNSAIVGLQVLTGSVGHDAISDTARDALDQIQAAQEAVYTLREQIGIWKEQRGGHRSH